MDEHPDIVKEFLEAHEETSVYINNNLSEAIGIVNSEIEAATGKLLDEDIINNAFARMTITTELNHSAIMEFAKISKEEGFIDTIPEESDVFTTEIN